MIQILAGAKGEGKTKRLLQMANDASKVSDGNVVFIDDDSRHMYDLNYRIRFVETSKFTMLDQNVFFGFICGILSQNSDIEKVFIDGLGNIVRDIDNDGMVQFIRELEKTCADRDEKNLDFTLIISAPVDTLPEEIKKYII